MNTPTVGLDLGETRSDIAWAGGAFDVSRLTPAVPAADHARGDDREISMGVEPPPNEPLERGWICSGRHATDPVAGGDLIEDLAIQRLNTPTSTRLRMPPVLFRTITDDERQRMIETLEK